MMLGVDLHNILDGGGVNYIVNIISKYNPDKHGFSAIHLWGNKVILSKLPDSKFIVKHHHHYLEKSLVWRLLFVLFILDRELKNAGCSFLFCPGGLYIFGRLPFVSISRNMMPFDRTRWQLYKTLSFDRFRLILLRWAHSFTFKRSNGMIFLTRHAKDQIEGGCGGINNNFAIIKHGVDHSLFDGRYNLKLDKLFPHSKRIRLIYPSRLEPYKHQVEVIKAVRQLRNQFADIELDMVGPNNPAYLGEVLKVIGLEDSDKKYIRYLGNIASKNLPQLYSEYDILVFASSCENLPNTLIEAMALGIPIVCSNWMPMTEIAKEACVYFNPEDVASIKNAILVSISNWETTKSRSRCGKKIAQSYSWENCANETFQFLEITAKSK